MYSLLIDTHNKKVTLVLYKNGKIINIINEESNYKHSQITIPSLDKLLKKSNLSTKDLNELIVVNGPGSFTGVRIAVTIAKTLAYCLNIPIKTIDALKILCISNNSASNIFAIKDNKGAYIGIFNSNNDKAEEYIYLSNNEIEDKFNRKTIIYEEDINIDYEKIYNYLKDQKDINCHEVNPIYIKGIQALNDSNNN